MSIHINAAAGAVAPVVLLPGDPLRAEWIASTYLTDVQCYNRVRGMLGFTGRWRGQPVSVQGSGMGQPSLAIYVTELFQSYDVDTVIRVGSCGGLAESVGLREVIIASGACTDSAMNRIRFGGHDYAPVADFGLLRDAVAAAQRLDVPHHVGLIFSADSFYGDRPDLLDVMAAYGVLGVEMEASALFTLAAKFGRRALSVCTVSDHIKTGASTAAEERERGFAAMVEIALEAAFGAP